jgi:hypothetical protein
VKHAGPAAIKVLAPLLDDIRRDRIGGLTERKPGAFYRKGQAFLHFHEDPAGFFADLKIDGAWRRFPVNHSREKATFMAAWRRTLKALTKPGE